MPHIAATWSDQKSRQILSPIIQQATIAFKIEHITSNPQRDFPFHSNCYFLQKKKGSLEVIHQRKVFGMICCVPKAQPTHFNL
jgi:hypothetical protein